LSYNEETISSLKKEERVRKRPGVIFGSDGLEGCHHSLFEIISNSIDEARAGYGDKIEVTLHADNTIEVRDYGRGVPLGYNKKEKRYNWELVYCELYAGGKYDDKNQGNTGYDFSIGLNGLGACATQYASEYMEVESYRDGKKYEIDFKKGKVVGKLKQTKLTKEMTGTYHKWRPDREVFNSINIDTHFLQNTLKKQAICNSGVKFIYNDLKHEVKYEYFYKTGILDFVKELTSEGHFSDIYEIKAEGKGRDREDKKEYRVKFEVAMRFSNEGASEHYFHNSSPLTHGGSPQQASQNAVVWVLNKIAKKDNKLRKNEKRITYKDISESLVIVSNSFSTETSYENQTKKSITNKFIKEFMEETIKEKLYIYFIENKAEADRILKQIIINKRSSEQAEIARKQISKKLSKKTNTTTNRVEKFIPCRSKDKKKRELYILEGDSALGATKLARDPEFQALMPVRGKVTNCLKASSNGIFKSPVIMDLLQVVGVGVEVTSRSNKRAGKFDLKDLEWDKIVICTDADVDGYHIRTLLLTFFYVLLPTLLEKGYIYIVESPLYEVKYKDRSYYAYSDEGKEKLILEHGQPISIQRSKGLGENDPDMMWESTMNPETRRLKQIVVEDFAEDGELFEVLMGDSAQLRREYLGSVSTEEMVM